MAADLQPSLPVLIGILFHTELCLSVFVDVGVKNEHNPMDT